jgi:tRNA threonylcarbamoyladenosine biosynthesis protein TsaB
MKIDAVALSEGPGSYTGLRIGTATAKGLCYGLDIPLIPVPTLEVLKKASGVEKGILIPMIDARRMEVYTSVMVNGEWMNGERAKAVVVENEESLLNTEETVYYFGDGAAKCQQVLAQPNWHYIPDIVPQAQYVCALAEASDRRYQASGLAYYEPYYLKEFIAAPSHVKGLK